MKKYLYCFKLYYLNAINYRFNTVVWLLFSNLRLVISIFFWALIYGGDTYKTLNGFTLYGVVTYLIAIDVFTTLLYALRSSGFMYSGMIKGGSLGQAMLKPQSLSMSVYFRNAAEGIAGLIPQAALVACAMPFAYKYIIVGINVANAASILLFLAVGSVSAHLFCSIMGCMAFWMEEAEAVMWSLVVLLNMATGFFIPIDFYPRWLVAAIELLPFSSWGYIQTKIFIGMYSFGRQMCLMAFQLAWILALWLINAFIWNKGVKRYSSVGG